MSMLKENKIQNVKIEQKRNREEEPVRKTKSRKRGSDTERQRGMRLCLLPAG